MTQNKVVRFFGASVVLASLTGILLVSSKSYSHGGASHIQPTEIFDTADERRVQAAQEAKNRRKAAGNINQPGNKSACEQRHVALETTMGNVSRKANRQADTFDAIFESVEKFYEDSDLALANYKGLVTATEATNKKARIEVGVLSLLDTKIDCSDPDAVVAIAAFSNSSINAKQALETYRTTLLKLINAILYEAEQTKRTDDQ